MYVRRFRTGYFPIIVTNTTEQSRLLKPSALVVLANRNDTLSLMSSSFPVHPFELIDSYLSFNLSFSGYLGAVSYIMV